MRKDCDSCLHDEFVETYCNDCYWVRDEAPSKWEPAPHYKPDTNAERIRAMSDEELAEWMYNGISTDPCDYCEYNNGYCDGSPCRGKADAETIIEWLKQPAEMKENEHGEK